eukprot:14353138-Heterocapsa_arctica.AAC.1
MLRLSARMAPRPARQRGSPNADGCVGIMTDELKKESNNIKLYMRCIFIMDDFDELMLKWPNM